MIGRKQLSCREMVELMTEYLDGALDPRRHARFERHLAGCPHCRTYLEQVRATIGAAGALREEDVPEPVLAALLDAFRAWKS